jgi:hypothetical protein
MLKNTIFKHSCPKIAVDGRSALQYSGDEVTQDEKTYRKLTQLYSTYYRNKDTWSSVSDIDSYVAIIEFVDSCFKSTSSIHTPVGNSDMLTHWHSHANGKFWYVYTPAFIRLWEIQTCLHIGIHTPVGNSDMLTHRHSYASGKFRHAYTLAFTRQWEIQICLHTGIHTPVGNSDVLTHRHSHASGKFRRAYIPAFTRQWEIQTCEFSSVTSAAQGTTYRGS